MRLACAWKKSGFDCCEAESVEKPWKTWIQSALFRWMCRFQIFPYQVAFAKHLFLKFGIYPRKFPRQFPSVMRWSLIVTIVFPFFVAAKVHSCNGHCGTFEKDEHLLLQRKNGCWSLSVISVGSRGFFRGFSGSRFKTLEPQLRRWCEESEEIEEFNWCSCVGPGGWWIFSP